MHSTFGYIHKFTFIDLHYYATNKPRQTISQMHSLDSLSLAETEEDYYYLAIIMLNNTAQASPHSTRIFGFVRFGLGLDDDDDDAV